MSSIISSISSQITSNIFSKVDTKNQGYINASDLSDALSKISGESSDASSDTEALFKSIDTDSDGKITKSELSTNIENLLSQLNSSSTQSANSKENGMPPPPPDGMRPPPPPDGEGSDKGITQEQASAMAADSKDSKMSALMTKISENFEAADANQDGKVTMEETRKYEESTKNASSETQNTSQSGDAEIMSKIAKLMEAYGLSGDASTSTVATSA